jgi:hypothetical protein
MSESRPPTQYVDPQEESDRELMRHALGLDRKPVGYRNYFVAGSDDAPGWERLVVLGFAVRNTRYNLSSDPCYHVTELGAKALGLKGLPK